MLKRLESMIKNFESFQAETKNEINNNFKGKRIPFFIYKVQQKETYIIERYGKFFKASEPGINFSIPLFDRIAFVHSLKNKIMNINCEDLITNEGVFIKMEIVLNTKIFNPKKFSYEVEDPFNALKTFSQSILRTEIGIYFFFNENLFLILF